MDGKHGVAAGRHSATQVLGMGGREWVQQV